MPLKLLVEAVERDSIRCLEEAASDGVKSYYIEGIFLAADVKNKNDRVYPLEIMQNEVARYTRECIDEHRAWGELTHPSTPMIDLKNTSHLIKSLKQNGTNFIGKAKIIDTPNGNICKALIREGGQLAVSSRGAGSLRFVNGSYQVQDDYYLSTAADIVADPSAPGAFVRAIMEQKEWVWDNGILVESDVAKLHQTVEAAHAMPHRFRDEAFVSAFKTFLHGVSRGK